MNRSSITTHSVFCERLHFCQPDLYKNTSRRSFLLLADAVAPVAGAISTMFFTIPAVGLLYYLGFFAGFLLWLPS